MTGTQKRVLRWRRPAVQADLPLPDPQDPAQHGSQPELPWWQRRAAASGELAKHWNFACNQWFGCNT